MTTPDQIAANLVRVRSRIAEAAARAGRDPLSVQLVAVTKTFPPALLHAAYQCGLRHFGENRVQEFRSKLPHLSLPGAVYHLIGHLQSNKASDASAFDWVQTVDSERLARRLDAAAQEADKKLSVLIQVKLDQEAGRSGVLEADVPSLVARVATLDSLNLRGLMVLPPYAEDPEGARPFFRRLRTLRDSLQDSGYPQMAELSMGMTHDFSVAIAEGATIVRLGTALFGPRPRAEKPGKEGTP